MRLLRRFAPRNDIRVGVVDYGMGNLHSVAKALALQGGKVVVTDDKKKLAASDLLVVPGVGAFGAAMKTLAAKKLDGFIKDWINEKKPYLGICLGFQLLFERSEESPRVKGLGLFKGDVVKFREKDIRRVKGQIPHMGWNTVKQSSPSVRNIFKGIKKDDYFYFVHSFFPEPADKKIIATQTSYGRSFCSAIGTGRVFASQYHPEKSGRVGLTLLKNILRIVKETPKS